LGVENVDLLKARCRIGGYCYDIIFVNARAPTQVKRYNKGEGFIRNTASI